MIPKILKGLRLLLLGLALASAPAHAESVTAMFSKAQKALKEGKTKSAYKSLIAIIKRYPDHEPSHLLLGHILFRASQIGKAYKHFKRVSPDLVTPDLGYEYGITMFQGKNCSKAIQGFARVPSGMIHKIVLPPCTSHFTSMLVELSSVPSSVIETTRSAWRARSVR